MTEIKKFTYQNASITFKNNNGEVMVNATEMAKPFGKRVSHFSDLQSTEDFILAFCAYRNRGKHDNNSADAYRDYGKHDIFIQAKNQHDFAWMHEVLAYKFAAWLDVNFEVWVYATIQKMIHSRALFADNYFPAKSVLLKSLKDNKAKLSVVREKLQKTVEFSEKLVIEEDIRKIKAQLAYLEKKHFGQKDIFDKDDEESESQDDD